MSRSRRPAPPKHLRPATATWWRRVVAEYDMQDHHLRLLQAAAESWDRAQQAREAIAKHGLTYTDRFGAPRTRPEVAVERDARIAFRQLIAALDLDADEGPE